MPFVALLDNQELFRESFRSLINTSFNDVEVNISVSNLNDFEKEIDKEFPDILFFDLKAISIEECDRFKLIIKKVPKLKLVAITDIISKEMVMKLISNGVSAYYSKDIKIEQLSKLISNLSQNDKPISIELGPVVKDKLVNHVVFGPSFGKPDKIKFSKREMEILELVCMEKKNAEISDLLGISVRTVESHRRKMIEKTESKTIVGVIVSAVQLNIEISSIDNESNHLSLAI